METDNRGQEYNRKKNQRNQICLFETNRKYQANKQTKILVCYTDQE